MSESGCPSICLQPAGPSATSCDTGNRGRGVGGQLVFSAMTVGADLG